MTEQPSPTARRDIAHHLDPHTNMARHEETGPLVLTHGKGIYVYAEQGKEYIEGLSGLWCTSLGFGEEALVQAAGEQLRRLPYYHSFTHKSHQPAIALAQRLIEVAPVPMSKVFFVGSGSEANDSVVKLVWYYNNARGRPDKKKIIARHKAYHGGTVASGSLTGMQLFGLAYNLGNFLRRLALPRPISHWSLRALHIRLIKIGAKVVRHARYTFFQMAEVSLPSNVFAAILRRIRQLMQPVPV